MKEILKKLKGGVPLNHQEAKIFSDYFYSEIHQYQMPKDKSLMNLINSLFPKHELFYHIGLDVAIRELTKEQLSHIFEKYHIISGKSLDGLIETKGNKEWLVVKFAADHQGKKPNKEDLEKEHQLQGNDRKIDIKNFFNKNFDLTLYMLKNAKEVNIAGTFHNLFQSFQELEKKYILEKKGIVEKIISQDAFSNMAINDFPTNVTLNIIKSYGKPKNADYLLNNFILHNVSLPKESFDFKKEVIKNTINDLQNIQDMSIISRGFPKQKGNALKYTFDNFDKLTEKDKENYLQYVSNNFCKRAGIKSAKVKIDNTIDSYGSHFNSEIRINLKNHSKQYNNKILDYIALLDTTFHELDHHINYVWSDYFKSADQKKIHKNDFKYEVGKLISFSDNYYDTSVRKNSEKNYYYYTPLEKTAFQIGEYVTDGLLGYFLGKNKAKSFDKSAGIELHATEPIINLAINHYANEMQEKNIDNKYTDFFKPTLTPKINKTFPSNTRK